MEVVSSDCQSVSHIGVNYIRHVNNVVKYCSHLFYGERLKVPERCWRANRHRLPGQQTLQNDQEGKIILTIRQTRSRNARNIRRLVESAQLNRIASEQ